MWMILKGTQINTNVSHWVDFFKCNKNEAHPECPCYSWSILNSEYPLCTQVIAKKKKTDKNPCSTLC